MKEFASLEEKIGIKFKNQDILAQSVVHRSYLNENPGFKLAHNERLEFLGDAVLELVVTEYLYNNYPNPEGELTNWRASLVNAKMLSETAKELDLDKYLYLSKGEAKESVDSKARQYILANAFEAMVGAIYLDQGYTVSRDFIKRFLVVKLPYILEHELYLDPKSKFQEMSQDKYGVTPTYKVLEEIGPDHAKKFKVGIYLEKELVATGEGSSKQEAQVEAALAGLKTKKWN
jgi:ribonuclease-3